MTDVERNAILGNVQRQYVGARYVTKFFQGPDGTPTWVVNVPYEALTIVTYLGNSYTSKVPVPAEIGNPSQNPTYWALTGNFNAQLEEYRQAVEKVENDILELTEKVNNIKKIKGIVCIGDSFGQMTRSWMWNVSRILQPVNSYQSARGGVGFVQDQSGVTLQTLAEELQKTIHNPDQIEYVFTLGGTNDCKPEYQNRFITAYNNYLTACRELFPNATLITGFNGTLYNNNAGRPYKKFVRSNMAFRSQQVPKSAFVYGCEFNLVLKNFLLEDLVHPNENGSRVLGANMCSAVLGGTPFYYEQSGGNIMTFNAGTPTIECYISKNKTLYTGDPITINSHVWFTLGTNNSPIAIDTDDFFNVQLSDIELVDSTGSHYVQGVVSLTKGDVCRLNITSGGSYSGVTKIINPFFYQNRIYPSIDY